MTFTKDDIEGFAKAVESLKKYRRADLTDDEGKSILDGLYTDLMPHEHILKKCLYDNTTYLIGRKGTGKSTLFLKMENEIRKKASYLPCYIDVKTTYEASQAQKLDYDYLSDLLSQELLEKYLLERSFTQSILNTISEELKNRFDSIFEKALGKIVNTKASLAKIKIEQLKNKINDNEHLKSIELPLIQKSKLITNEYIENEKNHAFGSKARLKPVNLDLNYKYNTNKKDGQSTNKSFSDVFISIFEIKDIITRIKDILELLDIRHLIIMLDDLSEINDNAIITFVDTIIAPLNNWSEEFIKFKIAAYPNRMHYGKIDPSKVDEINLDFYNLYSEFDRNKTEEFACDFTKRILEKRISYFTKHDFSYYFDLSKSTKRSDYFELLFQVSMNVPRIMGYILSYCHQNKIIFGKKITKSDIEFASEKYYNNKINTYFQTNIYSLASLKEKLSNYQLSELINLIVNKLLEIKKRISSGDLKGTLYLRKSPYTSHFQVDPILDSFLKTLELNHFISKYDELSDKDGNVTDIYCLNYGLAICNKIIWGKPKGSEYRKYFTQRPFSFTKLIRDFISNSEKIYCTKCHKSFTNDQLKLLEFSKFRCNECCGKVIIESILSDKAQQELKSIKPEDLLPRKDLDILIELSSDTNPKFAREIAEELDYSKQTIAFACKRLGNDLGLIDRFKLKDNEPYKYKITAKAKSKYINPMGN